MVNASDNVKNDLSGRANAGAPSEVPSLEVGWRTLRLVWPFLLTGMLLWAVAAASFHFLSAGRAYVGGESLWSKGQKDAVQWLHTYHRDCRPESFAAYRAAMDIPMGDRMARLELVKDEPDMDIIRRGFLQGRNQAEDMPGMVRLVRYFGNVGAMREVLVIWEHAEALLLQIDAVAHRLDAMVQARCDDTLARLPLMDEVMLLNAALTPLQQQFSDKLGEANRFMQRLLLGVMAATAVVFSGIGLALAWGGVRRSIGSEQSLADSEQRYELAVTGSNQALWDYRFKSRQLFVSESLPRWLGYASEQFAAGIPAFEACLHPEERASVMDAIWVHTRAGTPFEIDFRLRKSDGSYLWGHMAGRAFHDGRGRPTRVVGSIRDVTERWEMQRAMKAELRARLVAIASLRKTLSAMTEGDPDKAVARSRDDMAAISDAISTLARQMRQGKEQLEAVLGLSPDGFASFDAHGRLVYVSPAFTDLTSLTPAEVMGLDEQAFAQVLDQRCAAGHRLGSLEAVADAGRTGQRYLIELAEPVRRVLALQWREGRGAQVQSVLCLRDVTHETEVERLKSEFLTTAAHELRTPMVSIFGFAELMHTRDMPPARRAQALEVVYRQAGVMVSIIDDLLNLGRLESSEGADMERLPLDLAPLVAEVLAGFQAPQGRTAPQLHAAPGCAWLVVGDQAHLRRVLVNLLSNAYKYSPDGGDVTVTLAPGPAPVALDQECPGVWMSVRDQGIGLSPGQLARVGERFYRADASGSIQGTGLGVSIVKEIVALHQGALEIHSAVGEGTEVRIFLPLLRADG